MQTNGPDYTLRDLRRLLAKAFVTSNAGGGVDSFVKIQFSELSDTQALHALIAKLQQ